MDNHKTKRRSPKIFSNESKPSRSGFQQESIMCLWEEEKDEVQEEVLMKQQNLLRSWRVLRKLYMNIQDGYLEQQGSRKDPHLLRQKPER